jgi:hypothetical protein
MSAHVLQQQSLKPVSRQGVQRPCHVKFAAVKPIQKHRNVVIMAAAATEASPVNSSNGKVC